MPSRRLKRQEWWDQRREVVGTVLLYACFLAYIPWCIWIATHGLSLWWMTVILPLIYISVTIKGDV